MNTAPQLHAVGPRPDLGSPAQDRERVGGWVASRLPLLEAMLEGAVADLGSELREVRTAVDLAVGTRGRGGRRWRPLLTLAAAEACGGDSNRVLGVAAAVELTHTASLILDDLPSMDDAPTRRGFPSTHTILGPGTAILVAMGLLGRASELLARSPAGSAGIVAAWGEAFGLRGMAGGQAVDLTGKGCSFLAGRRRLHRRKTTALSAFALGAGARAAGAPEQSIRCLERYGRDLGWAYQLMDDAADAGEDLALGRPPGGRRPARQSGMLIRRAMGGLRSCPTLAPDGRDLLLSFARVVVPDAAPPQNTPARRPVAVTPLHVEGGLRAPSRGGRSPSALNGNA